MYASPSIRGYFGIAGHRPGHHAGWPGLDHYHRWREEVAGLGWVAWRAALAGTGSVRPGWLPEAVPGCGKLTSACRPPPGCGRMVRAAPCAWAMAWTMDSPRPRPSLWLVRSVPSRWKGRSSRSTAAAGTTGPVLITDRTAQEFLVPVTTSMYPPGTLCRSALSA